MPAASAMSSTVKLPGPCCRSRARVAPVIACLVAALFSSRRETGPSASPGTDGGEGVGEEVEADTHLHYVQVCTLRNWWGDSQLERQNSQRLHSRTKAVLEEEGASCCRSRHGGNDASRPADRGADHGAFKESGSRTGRDCVGT